MLVSARDGELDDGISEHVAGRALRLHDERLAAVHRQHVADRIISA